MAGRTPEEKAKAKQRASAMADRLSFLGPVETRAMFGGWGFRLDQITFASLMPDMSFRGDETVRTTWEAMGAVQFTYANHKTGKTTHMPYWAFSDEILRDQALFEDLATQAINCAQRAKK